MYDPISTVKAVSIETPFIPVTDLSPVDQFGFLDIRKTFESGQIDGDVNIRDERFNGVMDPDDLLNRPLDQFEALRQVEYVRTTLRATKAEPESVTPSGEAK